MNAIVMNTLTGAVSEYAGFNFQSITPNYAGSVNGLYALGGNLDVAAPIVARVLSGKMLWGGSAKTLLDCMFLSLRGSTDGHALVQTEGTTYVYPVSTTATGETKAKPGRGIRENYLAFGYTNTDGGAFTLDRMEVVERTSATRRV